MLALAGMSPAEREAKIDAIVKEEDAIAEKQKAEQEAAKAKEEQDKQSQQFLLRVLPVTFLQVQACCPAPL